MVELVENWVKTGGSCMVKLVEYWWKTGGICSQENWGITGGKLVAKGHNHVINTLM